MSERRTITTEYLIRLRESSAKKKSYIYAGFAVVVAILLIVLAIKPTLEKITTIKSEIDTKEKTYKALEARISALNSLDNQYNSNVTLFEYLPLVYPSNSNNS